MAENIGYALDYEGEIQNDGNGGYVVVEPGDYRFTVKSFERTQYPGGSKIPACKKVTVVLELDTSEGRVPVKVDFILWSTMEWKLSSFFRSIGMKKHGEKIRLDWQGAVGKSGMAFVKNRDWIGNDGKTHQANDVDKFYDPAEAPTTSSTSYIEQRKAEAVPPVADDDDDLPF